ncbi:hypothetical protein SAMN05660662_0183, partial [Blastococcus aurantiacus]
MDLIRGLRRWALARPHVLIVDAPGARDLRWVAEAEFDRRGWPLAASPADADLLLVLGEPGPELSAAVAVLWQQIPQPRLALHLLDVARLGPEFDTAAELLVQAAQDPEPPVAQGMAGTDDAGMDHGGGHEG